ncbi:MAG: glycosyltransferase family 2 protein [Minicystis sp.]
MNQGVSASPELWSVVLAAYQEAPTIAAVVRGALALSPPPHEVIVVDDGSRDDTARLAAEAGARVIRLPVNQGKGAALRRGIDAAEGEILVFLDADGQDDPAEIPVLLAAMDASVDLVIGSRFLGEFAEGAITPINRLGTRFLTEVLNLLFGARVTDCLAGFRAVRKRALRRFTLSARRYDIEVDLLIGVLQTGGRVVEVPVRRTARLHGASGLRSVPDGTRILLRMLQHRAMPMR